VRVAIRPRGILECLDLAVMFCGRRPLPVVAATALGAAPFILLNRVVASGLDAADAIPFAGILALETAWAAVPLTLYLGQSVFADRFSLRAAVRDFVGGLPALLLFQGLLRGACLAICVLAPVLFVGLYYLDQVILLERPPLAKVWQRRSAINRGRAMGIVRLACIDGLVLACGTVLGTRLLAAVASLWRGRGIGWDILGGEALAAAIFSWHGQIAFWATCGFLTVFRFFTYLDGRIRREGWDVELRLRADETYAGLTAGGGRRSVVRATIAILLAAVASAGHAASPTPEAESAARRALARQSFPWYDSATDRFRPLIEPDASPDDTGTSSDAPGQPGEGGGRGSKGGAGEGRRGVRIPLPSPPASPLIAETFGLVAYGLMIGLLVAVVVVVVWLLVRYGLRDGSATPGDPGDDGAASGVTEDAAAALPAGLRLGEAELFARAATHAEQGDFTSAALHLHAWMIVHLDRRGALVASRGKTNGQYRSEVAASLPDAVGVFAASSRLFEDAFFGRLPVSRHDFLAVWERRSVVGPVSSAGEAAA